MEHEAPNWALDTARALSVVASPGMASCVLGGVALRSQIVLAGVIQGHAFLFRNHLIMHVARMNGYAKVMVGDSCTRVAVKLLTNLCLGRGAFLAADTVRFQVHSLALPVEGSRVEDDLKDLESLKSRRAVSCKQYCPNGGPVV